MHRFNLSGGLLCAALLLPAPLLTAQAPQAAADQAAAHPQRILGTVTAIAEGAITVRQEGAAAGDISVAITPQTRLLRTAPGEKDLKTATPLDLKDLAVGDRVLIRASADSTPDHPSASILVAMKQADISQAHAVEASDWQKRGVAGIVASLDAGSGTVTLKSQAGAPALVIHTTPATVIRHYAPDSTAFADAHKVTFADIHAGDQIRARGARDEAAGTVAAEEIVAGSFRNIAGTVLSTDTTASTVTLTDLATKRPVTLHLEEGTQLRKLTPEMAVRMAHRGAAAGAGAPAAAGQGSTAGPGGSAPGGAAPAGAGRARGGDVAGMLQRAPSITLADLKKGDAVMIVASGPGAPRDTAITVIAGVEPLLTGAPDASAGLFSASWNLGGGGADAAGAEGGQPR